MRSLPDYTDGGGGMTRIYTRSGDDGTTGLIGGRRVFKDSLRIEAYGAVDELNAIIGVVRSYVLPARVESALRRVQDDLFIIGAELAVPEDVNPDAYQVPGVRKDLIIEMESEIDACTASLKPLQQFILPGGTHAGALTHVARTVARRAERCCVALARIEKVDPMILVFLNRLSDLLFVEARLINSEAGQPETHPTFRNQ
jgi:cob(I)alamin adenosyltransferase